MKWKILIISHGNLAESMVKVASAIMGNTDNLVFLGLKGDESREAFISRLESCTNEDCEYIVLADLMSGTPFNAAFILKQKRKNFHLAVGYNLPFLLTLLNDQNTNLEDALQDAIKTGKQMIFQVE